MSWLTALRLCLLFGSASLLSFGGGNSVVPLIARRSVEAYRWLSAVQFADLFAIAQAAPGPSILLVTLVGYRAAGVAGALLATAAVVLPAAVLVFVAARAWQSTGRASWHLAIQHGMAPVAVGLIAVSGLIIARGAAHAPGQIVLTAVATVLLCATRLHPLILLTGAGLAGWLGWV